MSDSIENPDEATALSPDEARDLLIAGRFLAEAGKQGLRWPDDALKLADLSGVTADLKSREVSGLDGVFAQLRQSRPFLFAAIAGASPGPEKGQDGYQRGELEAVRQRAAVSGPDADIAAYLRLVRQLKRRR
jgi:hypothetical protein